VLGLAGFAALVVLIGCVVAVTAADRRFAILGVTLALVAAPLVGVGVRDLLSLAFREVAVLTGSYLLWVASRHVTEWRDGPLPVFGGVFVVLGFIGAVLLAPALGPDRGSTPGLAGAVAAAIAALALGAGQRHVLAGGLSAILLTLAAALGFRGLTGTTGGLDNVVIGATLLAVTTAAAFLGSAEPRTSGAEPRTSGAEPRTSGASQTEAADQPAS
jgi:hypothetical protein